MSIGLFNAVKLLQLDPAAIIPVHGEPSAWADFARTVTR